MNFLVGKEGEVRPVGDLRDWPSLIRAVLESDAAIHCQDQACLVYGRRGGVKIGLSPGAFSNRCFERILSILTQRPTVRFLLIFTDPRWLPEIFDNFNDAVARLDEMRALTPGEAPRNAFFADALALARLDHPKRAALRAIFRDWQQSQGWLETGSMPMKRLEANETIISRAGGGDRLLIESWPQRRVAAYSAWTNDRLVGRELHEQPDPSYGVRAQESYTAILRQAAPRLEIVEAIVRPPDGPSLRVRYERLLLPWTSPSGVTFISGTSITRSRRLLPSLETAR